MTTAATVPLTDAQFDRLRTMIASFSGLKYGDNKRYLLENRLQQRLEARSLKNFDEYLTFLERDPRRQEELTFLFNQITTNETSFYRNGPQISAFQYTVLPELLDAKRKLRQRRLRIWSAGCSSGEEPYTLAIVACEVLGAEISEWRVEIIGNDISADMLEKAKVAEYGEYAMRATPLAVREKYFTAGTDGNWRLSPSVKKLVKFGFLNLSDDAAMKAVPQMDFVFCRNVLIYFDQDMKRRIVGHLHDALAPGGWLFIGHGESLASIHDTLELVQLRGAVAYKRPGTIGENGSSPPSTINGWRL